MQYRRKKGVRQLQSQCPLPILSRSSSSYPFKARQEGKRGGEGGGGGFLFDDKLLMQPSTAQSSGPLLCRRSGGGGGGRNAQCPNVGLLESACLCGLMNAQHTQLMDASSLLDKDLTICHLLASWSTAALLLACQRSSLATPLCPQLLGNSGPLATDSGQASPSANSKSVAVVAARHFLVHISNSTVITHVASQPKLATAAWCQSLPLEQQ